VPPQCAPGAHCPAPPELEETAPLELEDVLAPELDVVPDPDEVEVAPELEAPDELDVPDEPDAPDEVEELEADDDDELQLVEPFLPSLDASSQATKKKASVAITAIAGRSMRSSRSKKEEAPRERARRGASSNRRAPLHPRRRKDRIRGSRKEPRSCAGGPGLRSGAAKEPRSSDEMWWRKEPRSWTGGWGGERNPGRGLGGGVEKGTQVVGWGVGWRNEPRSCGVEKRTQVVWGGVGGVVVAA